MVEKWKYSREFPWFEFALLHVLVSPKDIKAWKNQLMDVEHENGKFHEGKMIHAALWFSF